MGAFTPYDGTVPDLTQSKAVLNANMKSFFAWLALVPANLSAIADAIIALTNPQPYNPSTTYALYASCYGSDGMIYTNLVAGTIGDNPVGSVTGKWFARGVSVTDIKKVSANTRENRVVDGDFNCWSEATSQSGNGYASSDMWYPFGAGSTGVWSQQSLTLGEVPGVKFQGQMIVTSSLGSSNCKGVATPIEDLRKYAGQTVTVTFQANSDASRNIAVEATMFFGTGGSPSAPVTGISPTLVSLSAGKNLKTVTLSIPSDSSKTYGTNNDDNLGLLFWFDAGSTYSARSANIGQQSGTFKITKVRVVPGTIDGDAIAEKELDTRFVVDKFYQFISGASDALYFDSYDIAGNGCFRNIKFRREMRIIPTCTPIGTWTVSNTSQPVVSATGKSGVRIAFGHTATGLASAAPGASQGVRADARLIPWTI